jgi:vitamin B12 transporter
MSLRSCLLAVAVACPLPLAAIEDPAPPAELDPMVVTATRTAVRESETLAAITVIGRADIERAQASDVAELLRFVAGVEIARAGGPGQLAAAFIRGGNSQHTLVLLDGLVWQWTATESSTAGGVPAAVNHTHCLASQCWQC